jgi:hypothetical protein
MENSDPDGDPRMHVPLCPAVPWHLSSNAVARAGKSRVFALLPPARARPPVLRDARVCDWGSLVNRVSDDA